MQTIQRASQLKAEAMKPILIFGCIVGAVGFVLTFMLAVAEWRWHHAWGYFVIWGIGLAVVLAQPALRYVLNTGDPA